MGNSTPGRASPAVEEHESKVVREAVERTLPAAYSLAMRICGSPERAAAACERTYAEWAAHGTRIDGWHRHEELRFLALVRTHALAERRASLDSGLQPANMSARPSSPGGALQGTLTEADTLGSRAVQLAYFDGMDAGSIAELLAERVEDVRAAMRRTLLALAGPGSARRERQNEHV